ncbi:MAG: 5-formyltetrahydrofolate cyclo-ligase [Gammaproteobacteria bacterium]|nr:5-formyltetrahydrofolate cyclo-ligase [Gammaproteobacteria bacterium]
MTNSKTDKMVIRQQVRKKRSALPDYQQKIASAALSEQVLDKISEVHQAGRIAFYLSQDGEIGLGPLMDHCYKNGRQCFLPVLDSTRENELKFAEWTPDTSMSKNKYGIAEPVVPESQLLPAGDMQLIFMPLVAFDDSGQRLGMGGGYYDRSLAACSNSSDVTAKPLLVATGHDFQFVPKLPHESWDITPDITITPDRIIRSTARAET